MDTLVINAHHTAVNMVGWQQALSMLVSGRAVAEREYEDWFIRCPSKVWKVPTVVRLASEASGWWNRSVRFNRKNVWLRDKGACQYCGRRTDLRTFTFDHILPKSHGGKTTWTNVVVACLECNQAKRDRTPDQAQMKVRKAPIKPRDLPGGFTPLFSEGMPSDWKDFLRSTSYWYDKLEP